MSRHYKRVNKNKLVTQMWHFNLCIDTSHHISEIIKHDTCGGFEKLVPSSRMMQARMAISAPMLRPMGRTKASTLHDWTTPSLLQPHTRMVSVLVLLIGGSPSSLTTMGSRYTSCFWRRNESCFAKMLMELSEEWKKKVNEDVLDIYIIIQ